MFGGKGGVGKTTCSAAAAIEIASSGRSTLIITSDTTPSLSDIFEEEIGDSIKSIEYRLDAVEISESTILNTWKKKFGPDFYDILAHLIDIEALDADSRHQLLDYIGSAPSLREETMLDLIVDMAESGDYETIVWDTAPAGETLNLLNIPSYIRSHLRAGARVFEGLDRIGKRIIGGRSIAQIMDEWVCASERISEYIHRKASFIVVANPEVLVLKQARRVVEMLKSYHINLHGLVINKSIKNADSKSFAMLKDIQQSYIAELMKLVNGLPTAIIPFSLKEIRGKKALREVGEGLVRELNL